MKPFIVANWKANENIDGVQEIEFNSDYMDLVIAPPDLYIDEVVRRAKPYIKIGSQDCSRFKEGAYTGETPASLLKKKGAEYVILGHCERRKYFNEDAEVLAMKVQHALQAGLRVILCIGENRADRESKNHMNVLYNQFFSTIGKDICIDVAYEPVWSIGTGITPDPEDVHEILKNIRKWGEGINVKGKVLYGGSVSDKNINDLINIKGCDGFFIGSTSLKTEFPRFLRKIEKSVKFSNERD